MPRSGRRIDGVLERSPGEYVRRLHVPAESPTLGLAHLQFEALLTAAKQSPNRCDFALVTMLGLLGGFVSSRPLAAYMAWCAFSRSATGPWRSPVVEKSRVAVWLARKRFTSES
ncbi:MAG: integrase/recombinase XerD [Kribbellaceae bacterium]|nr:integrase/recombinase XerD [Kribbellaceae bacterium]